MKKILPIIILLLISALLFASCTEQAKPAISVEGGKYMKSPKIENAAAAFMVITNDGKADDRITGCSVKDYPGIRGELHDVVGGKMVEVGEIKVPAGAMVVLKKGSLHLMFFDVPQNFNTKSLTIIIKFEKIGTIEVEVTM